ncbi:MAG: polysaccharide biosynthesis C-terminal domain-containing protein, partial [Oscillospiraceae bacterium]|nr:polysaccharide biosynthesis C-terminal domain-containing protein [Oscillospiraceae bacterium]
VARRPFWITGLLGTLIMFGAAFIYPNFIHQPQSMLAMLVMAPSVLLVCLTSAYRGLFEGSRNMKPTAISQVIEVLFKLAVGLTCFYGARWYGLHSFELGRPVFGQMASDATGALTLSLPWMAAGAMLGITAGSLFAYLFVWIRYRVRGEGIPQEQLDKAPPAFATRTLLRTLLAIALPVALGVLATQLTNIIDVLSLKKSLAIVVQRYGDSIGAYYANAMASTKSVDLQGFLTSGRDIAMVFSAAIPNITLTFGISALPVLTSAWALNDRKQIQSTVATVMRLTLLVALPSCLGMTVLAKPIIGFVYSPAAAFVSGPMLWILGPMAIFVCLVGPINAMLQAMGRADIPAKIVLAGGAVKIGFNIWLVSIPALNINGAAISSLICYIFIVTLSLFFLRRVMDMEMGWKYIFLKPFIASAASALAAWGSYMLFNRLLFSVGIAIVLYFLLLLFTKALTREELLMLPKGEKIAKVLEKIHCVG